MGKKATKLLALIEEYAATMKDCYLGLCSQPYTRVYMVAFVTCCLFCVFFWGDVICDDPLGIRSLSFPIPPLVLIASFASLFCLAQFGRTYSLEKIGRFDGAQLFVYGIVILILSISVWAFSSERYYYGVDSGFKKNAGVYRKSIALILHRVDMSDEEKKDAMDYLLEDNKGMFLLLKNGEKYYEHNAAMRDSRHYQETSYGDGFASIKVGGDVYELHYTYYNQPYWAESLVKAVTISFVPDLLERDLRTYNRFYVQYKLYNRSLSLWGALLAFSLICWILWVNSIHKEYMRNTNLASMLLIALSHLHHETDRQISNGRNILQEISNRYEDDYDQELIAVRDQLEMAPRKARHDLNNKWTDDDVYRKYPEIQGYINTILEDLHELRAAISIKMDKYTLQELMVDTEKHIAEYKKGSGDFTYQIDIPQDQKTIIANIHHFWSIITNLISNAKEATVRRRSVFRKEGKAGAYKSAISLYISVLKAHLVIVVEDNGGGFPDVQKIYREPVISSKTDSCGQERIGEGTTYIRVFTQMMKGKIKAENLCEDGVAVGARTMISFPIKDTEG